MISLRYHVVSIAAVFLALALGVVLGATTLSDSILSGISGQQARLGEQVTDLRAQRAGLDARMEDADRFATGVGPLAVRGLLAQRTVVLVSTPTASSSAEDAVGELLAAAGAKVTGRVALTRAFSDPNRSDQLSSLVTQLIPAGAQLPVASDSGTLAGGLFADLLLLNKSNNQPQATMAERSAALAGLASAGFVQPVRSLEPAQLAVVVTGGAETGATAGDRATMLARFATQFERGGAGTVLAGASGAASGSGPIGVVRADSGARSVLSTVDDVDTAAGRVVTVLALREQLNGKAGAYGTAGNASAPVPQPTAS